MAVERFKTQVLILHPETRVLDACRAFFGDDYTVHLAQSGREALSALGETPIDFFVSAEDLPGMSGSEALREARKRSPQTQGILLAPINSSQAEIEALGNAKDFAAVLNGNATPAEIRAMVVDAAKRQQLAKLNQSANDAEHPSANDSGEHIVMSGDEAEQVPLPEPTIQEPAFTETQPDVAVKPMPNAGQRKAAAGAAAVEVLVLTQDQSFFRAIANASRGEHQVHIAPTLQEATDVMALGRVGVLVTDAAVAPSDVQIITSRLREIQPALVAIVAGRRDDGDAMMELISEGTIYRFLLKPVSPGRARLAMEASVKKSLEYRENPPPPPAATMTATRRSTIMEYVLEDDGEFGKGKLVAGIGALLIGLGIGAWALFSGSSDDEPATTITEPAAIVAEEAAVNTEPSTPAESPLEAAAAATNQDASVTEELVTAVEEPAPVASETVTAPQSEPEQASLALVEMRRRAFRALADGRIASPANDNALSLYAAILEANPGADDIQDEFDQVISEGFQLTEDALLNGRLDEASTILLRIREVAPFQARLPFLEAQLRKEQRRAIVEQARSQARAGDITTALATLDQAASLSAVSDPAVTAAREEILASQDKREVDELLDLAGARLAAGQLLSPREDNARFYYQAILEREPQNGPAQKGLELIGAALLSDAESALRAGNLQRAGSLLDAARASGARNSDVNSVRSEINAAQDAAQAAAEAEAAAEKAAADLLEQERVEAEAQAAENIEISADLADALPALQQNELVRTRYVAPIFPRSAVRRGVGGWVQFEFTITPEGSVTDIEVVESEPGQTFVGAATRALTQWEYQPYIDETGTAIDRRAQVKIAFEFD